MAYSDKYGATTVRDNSVKKVKGRIQCGWDIIKLSWDYDDDENDKSQRVAHILYVPYYPEHDHDHIIMNLEEAKIVRDWLTEFINDVEGGNQDKIS